MSWLRNLLIFSYILSSLNGCGVKGDPLPPLTPAELGRGRPTYKRATEKIQIDNNNRPAENQPAPSKDEDDDESD